MPAAQAAVAAAFWPTTKHHNNSSFRRSFLALNLCKLLWPHHQICQQLLILIWLPPLQRFFFLPQPNQLVSPLWHRLAQFFSVQSLARQILATYHLPRELAPAPKSKARLLTRPLKVSADSAASFHQKENRLKSFWSTLNLSTLASTSCPYVVLAWNGCVRLRAAAGRMNEMRKQLNGRSSTEII